MKFDILNKALQDLGYGPLTEKFVAGKNGTQANGGYNKNTAAENRQRNLGGLNPSDYPAALLPAGYNP